MEEQGLTCHTTLKTGGKVDFKSGKRYKVADEDEYGYTLINEQGYRHIFTKEKDEDGKSYNSWFTK